MEELKSNPILYVLVGPSGSGKSTFAREYVRYHRGIINWVSSDNIRKELYGDESIQKDHAKVFDLMFKRTVECLKKNESVIYDATNLSSKHRRHLIRQVRAKAECEIYCELFVLPIEKLVENDANRERSVGVDVIRRQIGQFQVPSMDEGWDYIFWETEVLLDPVDFLCNKMDITHDNSHHQFDVKEHCVRVGEIIEALGKPVLAEAAFLHDCGKPFTKTFTNARGEVTEEAHYYGHQNWGAYYSLMMRELNPKSFLEVDWKKILERAFYIQYHMEPFFRQGESWDKFVAMVGEEQAKNILLLHEADIQNA